MRIIIKWRFILLLATVLTFFGLSVHFIHRSQVRKQVGVFLHQADVSRDLAAAALEAGDSKAAATNRERERAYLERYLMARPNESEIRERLVHLVCDNAIGKRQTLEAYLALEELLRRDPERDELRRFAIDFASKHGLFKEALGQLRILMTRRPQDVELEQILAKCLMGAKQYEEASQQFAKLVATYEKDATFKVTDQAIGRLRSAGMPVAISNKLASLKNQELSRAALNDELVKLLDLDELKQYRSAISRYSKNRDSTASRPENRTSDPVESYAALASVMRLQLKSDSQGDSAIERMLDECDWNFRAHLAAAKYFREFGKPERAEEELARARELEPDNLDVLLMCSDSERVRYRSFSYERKKKEATSSLQSCRQLLDRALQLYPKSMQIYLAIALLEADTGKLSEAIAAIGRGLQVVPDSSELLLDLIEYQFQAGNVAGAEKTFERLTRTGVSQDAIEYERARISYLKENWLKAAQGFEAILHKLQDKPPILRQTNFFLGRCYEELGQNERRFAAFNKAVHNLAVNDRLWVPAMIGVAEAELALGRSADAITTYRKVTRWFPAAWIPIAKLEMIEALKAEAGKADWKNAEEAVTMAEKALAENFVNNELEVKLSRVRLDEFRGRWPEARKLLEELKAARPKERAVWIELAMLDAREKNPQAGLDTLALGQKQVGDCIDILLARVELWILDKDPDLATKVLELSNQRGKFTLAEQRYLLRHLAELTEKANSAGADEAVGRLWGDLAGVKPFDLNVQLVLFDRAQREGKPESMEKLLKKIREIDGDGGQWTRLVEAIIMIQRSQEAKDPALRERAFAILNAMEHEPMEKSVAAKVALGQAIVYDINGNSDEALEKFKKAISSDEPNPQATRRVMEILAQKKRYPEAMSFFQKLPQASTSSSDVQRIAAELSLRTEKWKDAIALATTAVSEDSKNFADLLWLGRMYWSVGQREKSEGLYRKAAELAPDSLECWLVLIDYLVTTHRMEEAARTLAIAKEKVAKAEQSQFLAFAYAEIGEVQKAISAFAQARTEHPTDVHLLAVEGEYLLQMGLLANAREAFQRVIASPIATPFDKAIAKQRLALALAADPDYATSRSAIELLGPVPSAASGQSETPAQRRTRAIILACQKDRASKFEAIALLRGQVTDKLDDLSPIEQFTLARLYEAVGDQNNLRIVMTNLLKSEQNKLPIYIGYFSLWLLRKNEIAQAQELIEDLVKKDPESIQTAELKARLAAAKKDLSGARAILVPKADAPGAPIGIIAKLCEEVGLYEDAERLWSTFVERNRDQQPRVVLLMAAFYGRRSRTEEALKICDEARTKLPAAVVGEVALGVLYNATAPSKADASKVSGWLEEAAKNSQGKDRAALIQELASIKNLQGDYLASAALYRQAIEANSRDVVAMNNLAFLLSASEKKHDEALALIDRAKKLIGENPSLLDTEALILLNKGDVDKASVLLEAAVNESPSGAAYFHLVEARLAASNVLEAKRAWRRAQDFGLRVGELHPLERAAYEKISLQLK